MLRTFALAVLSIVCLHGLAHAAEPAALSLGPAGTATEAETITIAAPLINRTRDGIANVTIERAIFATATSRALPARLEGIAERAGEIVQAQFDAKGLQTGKT